MAKYGVGTGHLPLFCSEQEIAKRELEVILQDHEQPEIGVYAVYLHWQYLIARVCAFVDFLLDKF